MRGEKDYLPKKAFKAEMKNSGFKYIGVTANTRGERSRHFSCNP